MKMRNFAHTLNFNLLDLPTDELVGEIISLRDARFNDLIPKKKATKSKKSRNLTLIDGTKITFLDPLKKGDMAKVKKAPGAGRPRKAKPEQLLEDLKGQFTDEEFAKLAAVLGPKPKKPRKTKAKASEENTNN